ncbi:hypothetical protein CPB86DRAFT_717564, partial [Serendipita vermifera]
DSALRSLLHAIRRSNFCVRNQHEPVIGTQEAEDLFCNNEDVRQQVNSKLRDKSIYYLFLDEQHRRCCLCGCTKTSATRAISCVRSHLGHRPFPCPGAEGGCRRCNSQKGYARFFSQALLHDHIVSQANSTSILRRGGMKRHWESQHKEEALPPKLYLR